VVKKKHHSDAEIAAKLTRADVLTQQGRTQSDIARALEVSVMTFHRWRKTHQQRAESLKAQDAKPDSERDHHERVAELQLENSRLRRLVTDLLLEKLKLEEESGRRSK
jgi:transposase-like protein